MNRKCPHADIRDCPLYHAGHEAGLPTCIAGDWAYGCLVEQGASYDGILVRLRGVEPKLVAVIEWNADARSRADQRARNMRAAGIH